jgi:hypothetical protein
VLRPLCCSWLNLRRISHIRTAEFNVEAAWRALIEADKKGGGEVDLKTVLGNDELLECKERTSAELKRCASLLLSLSGSFPPLIRQSFR